MLLVKNADELSKQHNMFSAALLLAEYRKREKRKGKQDE